MKLFVNGFGSGRRFVIDHDFGEDGIASFGGTDWPHGSTGPAVPHGSVFSIP